MKRLLETLLSAALVLLVGITVSSCVYDNPDVLEDGPEAGTSDVRFKFNIYSGDIKGTRSLGFWEQNAANVAERILDPSDMRVMIFSEGASLLTTVIPAEIKYNDPSTANDGYYSLTVAFTSDYFDQYDAADDVSFSIVILANLESIGGTYTKFTEGSTLWSDVQERFTMDSGWFPTEADGIPMYGYQSFTVRKSMLTQDDMFASPIGSLNLLRAVSKIEVRDEIVNKVAGTDGEMYPKVTGVEMISWVDEGYLAPKNFSYPSGLYSANIPTNASVTNVSVPGVLIDGAYRFYCPEAKLDDMRFRVAAVLEQGGETKYYEVSLSQYADEFGTSDLVRNHICRFNVKAVNTVADLTVTVADWETFETEYELENVVSMEQNGFLEWSFSNPDDFSVTTVHYDGRDEQQLSILNSTNGYATGTFHIQSPKGAKWKAYFVPGENGVDAFEFVDVDESGTVVPGSESVFAEGNVGERATIHIRGKGPADVYRHTAELVIEVHTVDGATLLTPLTPDMSTRYIIYRENKM